MHRASWLAAAAINAVIAIVAEIFASLVLPAGEAGATATTTLVTAGARFQMFHALATMALCALAWPRDGIAWLFFYGTLLFSGALYLRAFGMPPLVLALAAVGGVLALLGWLTLFWSALTRPKA